MSSVAPTREELSALLKKHNNFPIDHKGCVVMNDEALFENGGGALLKLRDLVRIASCMCITSTDGSGTVTRRDIKTFLEMALTLLTPVQRSNLENLQYTRGSTVSLFTYQQIQWMYHHVTKSWLPLSTE